MEAENLFVFFTVQVTWRLTESTGKPYLSGQLLHARRPIVESMPAAVVIRADERPA